jgi:hypothetical protein
LALGGEFCCELLRFEFYWCRQVCLFSYFHETIIDHVTIALDLRSFWVYSLVGPQQYGTFDARAYCIPNCPNELHSAQVKLPYNNGFHVHHRRRPRRDLFCVASQWLHLHMGRRKRRTETCPLFRFSRRLVVNHSLDDIHGGKLSSKLLN